MKPEGEGKAEDGMVQGMSGEAGYPNGNPTTTRTEIQQLPERKVNNYPNEKSTTTRTVASGIQIWYNMRHEKL